MIHASGILIELKLIVQADWRRSERLLWFFEPCMNIFKLDIGELFLIAMKALLVAIVHQ